MTREEALKIWLPVIKTGVESMWECNEALDMAIKALEQQPCDDAISREALLELVADYDLSMGQVVKGIHALPSVQPKQKTGHWIFDEILDKHYYCSECKSMGVDYWDYCPNCGAKMEGDK